MIQRTSSFSLSARFAKIAAAVGLLALGGCMMGPDYKRPKVDAPTGYRGDTPAAESGNLTGNVSGNLSGNQTGNLTGNVSGSLPGNLTGNTTVVPAASVADLAWWQLYNDPVLQQLIQEALKNNYDVRIAATRVEQARQLAIEQQSALYPQINYGGNAGRGRNQVNGGMAPQGGLTNDSVFAQIGVGWELDVWGKLRRLDEAAKAQYYATVEGQRGVWLSLVSDVAADYFQLVGLDAQLQIAKDATKSYGDTLNLFQERLEGGVASLLETSSAGGALGQQAAQIPDYERQIILTENQLSVLLGRNPGPIPRGRLLDAQVFPPEIPAGLPTQLMERRPDVLQAEQLLRAANAQIGVAKAQFFPQLSITGALGKVSNDFSTFTAGGANAWNIVANLAGPIFQGGLLTAQYKEAKAAWEDSKLSYQSTILNAFREVSDSLTNHEKLAQVRVQQVYAVSNYAQSVDVATKRYIAGKASYLDVLEAQKELFPSESRLVDTEVSQLLAIVQLYKALGGGWQLKGETFLQEPAEATGTGNATITAPGPVATARGTPGATAP